MYIDMGPDLHKAAVEGNVEPFKAIAKDVIESLVTVTKNTALHINIIGQEDESKRTKFVNEILEICPSLLLKANAKGDTPLHVAAKCGHDDVVRVVIEKAKSLHQELESGVGAARQMIGMINKVKNTALHEAVSHDRLDVVKILTEKEPDFPYCTNAYGETPLYMAAAKGSYQMIDAILENCPSAAHQGPDGKTALHPVAIQYGSDLLKKICDKKKGLIRERDQYGWTPIHYAAYFGWVRNVKLLLEFDRSVAYLADNDRKMTALHLAAAQGHAETVELIISYSPECYELVDLRGWNVLHFAVVSFSAEHLKQLMRNPFVRNLINEKDDRGNTPLHVLAAFCPNASSEIVGNKSGGDYQAVNKENMSVVRIMKDESHQLRQEILELSNDVASSGQYPNGFIRIKQKGENQYEEIRWFWKRIDEYFIGTSEAAESHLIVAALIATVTFAAGFTLPGGYKSEEGPNQGTAILSRKTAFQAFVVTDAIAMVLSLSAVFVHFIMSLRVFKKLVILFAFALLFTIVAMVAMVIAFITGTYAMLSPSLGLAITTCFIGLSFFLLMLYLLYKAVSFRPAIKEN